MWLNVDLFQREGIALPSWDTTWQQFLDAAIRLTKRDAGGPAAQLGFGRPGVLYWLWSAGGDLYSQDGTRFLIDQPPALEALTWLQEAVHKHRVCPNPQEQADSTLSAFPSGRIGAVFGVRGSLGIFRTIESFTFDAAPIPKGPRGRVTQLAIGYTSIWMGSKVPDAAFSVLNFICSAEGQRLKISRGYAHPSRKSLVDQPWFRDFAAPRAASNRINTVFPDTLKRGEARTIAPHPNENDITRVFNANLAALWDNSKPPRAVAQAIIAEGAQYLVK
jgi:ABC-type glycerol-3-phosphate transport system substrate-binding protein